MPRAADTRPERPTTTGPPVHRQLAERHDKGSHQVRLRLGQLARAERAGGSPAADTLRETMSVVPTDDRPEVITMRSAAHAGHVDRRCGCRDHDGRRFAARCPELAADPGHSTWTFSLDLPSPDHRRNDIRHGGHPTTERPRRTLSCPGFRGVPDVWACHDPGVRRTTGNARTTQVPR